MADHQICWQHEARRGGPLHIARHLFASGTGFSLHHHEFAEVFWIESGALRHTINGQVEDLRVGHLACVRPQDHHQGEVLGDRPASWINVSFPLGPLDGLAARYGAGEWPWAASGDPRTVAIGSEALERLRQWTSVLAAPNPRRLDLESFLLDVARLVAGAAESPAADGLPNWLRDALPVFTDPRHLPGGVPRLAKLADRSIAYLNRVVRSAQGRTATDLVTELRLDWAANQLRLSNRPIADIATSAGLPNLGHFYRRFQQRFGTTPRRYRVTAWGTAPR